MLRYTTIGNTWRDLNAQADQYIKELGLSSGVIS